MLDMVFRLLWLCMMWLGSYTTIEYMFKPIGSREFNVGIASLSLFMALMIMGMFMRFDRTDEKINKLNEKIDKMINDNNKKGVVGG